MNLTGVFSIYKTTRLTRVIQNKSLHTLFPKNPYHHDITCSSTYKKNTYNK